ncbi:putative invertase inhibitor [Telopea speciosissima]|uniref:putative invertase inhibitor n=1 Tax=Telopea speciosissima TaxID=54955 RepID=UPI001CC640AD|nr:putative invertase inhibitor [Telopea speciosissima]
MATVAILHIVHYDDMHNEAVNNSIVDADIVHETCHKVAHGIKDYEFCVAALEEDPRSHSADLQGLGIISMELIIENATKIGSRIKGLLNDQKYGRDAKRLLQACEDLYSMAKDVTKQAIDHFKSKDYHGASSLVDSAQVAATTCEDGFKGAGLKSPLIAEDNYIIQLTSIVVTITKIVH